MYIICCIIFIAYALVKLRLYVWNIFSWYYVNITSIECVFTIKWLKYITQHIFYIIYWFNNHQRLRLRRKSLVLTESAATLLLWVGWHGMAESTVLSVFMIISDCRSSWVLLICFLQNQQYTMNRLHEDPKRNYKKGLCLAITRRELQSYWRMSPT